jgi:hypothetical protein
MKEPHAEDQPYLAGQTVTAGVYTCVACGAALELAEGKVTNLPVCSVCQNDTWRPG